MGRKQILQRMGDIRKAKKLSAYELSLRIGKSTNYIHEVEKGKINVSIDVILAICNELGINPKELFD